MARYFHRTIERHARSILRRGFRDGTGHYLTESVHTGVWLSDVPLDTNDGAEGDALLLVVEIDGRKVAPYEWKNEAPTRYREFLVPVRVLNRHGSVRRARQDESD